MSNLVDPWMRLFLGLGDVDVASIELEHRVRRQPLDRLLVVWHDGPVLRGLKPIFLATRARFDDVIQVGGIGSYDVVVVALQKINQN